MGLAMNRFAEAVCGRFCIYSVFYCELPIYWYSEYSLNPNYIQIHSSRSILVCLTPFFLNLLANFFFCWMELLWSFLMRFFLMGFSAYTSIQSSSFCSSSATLLKSSSVSLRATLSYFFCCLTSFFLSISFSSRFRNSL
jgi:hypothetical protein